MSTYDKLEKRYQVVIGGTPEWKKELATLLLADAIASVVDSPEHLAQEFDGYDPEFLQDFRSKIISPQTDIFENVVDLADDYDLDINKYLNIGAIDAIAKEVQKDLKVSLEDIYNANDTWANHLVLQAVGHGVAPFDDGDFVEWLEEQDSDVTDWNGHSYYESPTAEAELFVEDALAAYADEVEASSAEDA